MRFSEAIRLGAMNEPQCKGSFHMEVSYPAGPGEVLKIPRVISTASCALGSAMKAVGIAADLSPCEIVEALALHFGRPLLRSILEAPCPVCGVASRSYNSVAHLNNKHDWTRERIADWVEGFEALSERLREDMRFR